MWLSCFFLEKEKIILERLEEIRGQVRNNTIILQNMSKHFQDKTDDVQFVDIYLPIRNAEEAAAMEEALSDKKAQQTLVSSSK